MEFDLSIDPLALDQEWLEQPNSYVFHASKLADAKKRLDEAKNNLEVVKAELYRSIAADPGLYELAKTTEAAINATIPIQPAYQQAKKEEIEAKHDVQIYEGAVQGLEHRKKALEKLVELHHSGYHSEPRAKRQENKEEVDQLKQRRHAAKHSKPIEENSK